MTKAAYSITIYKNTREEIVALRCERAAVSVIDSHQFRRAGVALYLSRWANRRGVDIQEIDIADGEYQIYECNFRMCVVVVGGKSLSDAGISQTVDFLRRVQDHVPLVVVSDIEDDIEAQIGYQSGIRGLISTKMSPEVAIAALDFILSGGSYFPMSSTGPRAAEVIQDIHMGEVESRLPVAPDDGDANLPDILHSKDGNGRIVDVIATGLPGTASDAVAPGCPEHRCGGRPLLTARQEDVLEYLSAGKSNKEIARALDLSEATVKIHVRHLMRKLGVSNRTQVAIVASGQAAGAFSMSGPRFSAAARPAVTGFGRDAQRSDGSGCRQGCQTPREIPRLRSGGRSIS